MLTMVWRSARGLGMRALCWVLDVFVAGDRELTPGGKVALAAVAVAALLVCAWVEGHDPTCWYY